MTERTTRASKLVRYFQLFRAAVAGTEKEFTTGSIDRAIFMLSVPMILEMVMESLFAVVDVYFVGKLGVDAVATVGLTESVITLVYSVAMGVAMAATALVARRTGEKNLDEAAHSGVQAIYVGIGMSVLFSVVGVVFAKDILRFMGGSAAVVNDNYQYTQIMMGSNVIIMLLFLINGIFRGAGDASIAMRSLWLANALNIVLCPMLINGWGPLPQLGLKGAAIATTIGRGCGILFQLYFLFSGRSLIRIRRPHLKIDFPIMGTLLKMAGGITGQFLINSASWIFLARIVASFGSDATAGYTIGIRVIIFTLLPAWGLANAAATLVGQNLGAQQPDRAERSAWRAGMLNMIFLGILAVIFFISADWIIRLFSDKPDVVEYGKETLRYICLGYLFYGYGMVIIQSFNGAGDSNTPIVLNIFGFWLFQIPFAYLLAIVFHVGPKGVFLAVAVTESLLAIAAMILFKRGKWKEVKV